MAAIWSLPSPPGCTALSPGPWSGHWSRWLGICWVGWLVWAILLALTGLQQPSVPRWPGVGRGRHWMALLALAMLLLTFTPAPVANDTFPQVAHMIKYGSR